MALREANEGGDDADTCTFNNIQTLLGQATTLLSPAVQLDFVGWKRIRDPRFTPGTPDSKGQYGSASLACSNFAGCYPANRMHEDCYSAWGVPLPGSIAGGPGIAVDTCTRGITVVFMKAGGTVGLGKSSAQALLPSDADLIGPTCDFSQIGNETYDPVVIVGDPNQVVTAHEIGHALGLPHGNGIDDDCNGVWDQDPWFCDQGESAADHNANNVNLMTWNEATNHTVVTDIQRGVVRTFALHSVPTLGTWGAGCKAATPPTPPDDTTVLPEPPPSDGGIIVGGDGGGRPPTVTTSGCGCRMDGGSIPAPAWGLALLSLVVARRRRRW